MKRSGCDNEIGVVGRRHCHHFVRFRVKHKHAIRHLSVDKPAKHKDKVTDALSCVAVNGRHARSQHVVLVQHVGDSARCQVQPHHLLAMRAVFGASAEDVDGVADARGRKVATAVRARERTARECTVKLDEIPRHCARVQHPHAEFVAMRRFVADDIDLFIDTNTSMS